MKYFLLIVLLCVLGCTPLASLDVPRSVRPAATPLEETNWQVLVSDQAMEEGMPSAVIAVARASELLVGHQFGFASRENRTLARSDTPYSIASITKPMTAVAVMMLAERGLIDLDAPIDDYLDEQKLTAHVGQAEDATVRRVLHHTAGLPLSYDFYYEDENRPRPEMNEAVRANGLIVSIPGETQQYSNFGYALLEFAIENVSGQSYSDYLQTELFEPLGMRNSFVATTAEESHQGAVRYSPLGEVIPFYDFTHRGASAVYASASDLVRFGSFLSDASLGESALLSAEAIAEMTSEKYDVKGNRDFYGLGLVVWWQNGHKVIFHSGGMPGVSANLFVLPDESLAVAAVANVSEADVWPLIKAALSEYQPDLYPEQMVEGEQLVPEGVWSGFVYMADSSRLAVKLTSSHGSISTLEISGTPVPVASTARVDDEFFEITINRPPAIEREPHSLRLKLRLRGNKLQGYATTLGRPSVDRGPFARSYWIELVKF